MTHQEGKSSLLSGSYVITLTVEIDKLIEKDYNQKTTTVSRPKQKFEIVITPISDEQSNQTQTENSDTEILILKLKQTLSKTVIRKAKVQHHQKNLHPIWILNQQ